MNGDEDTILRVHEDVLGVTVQMTAEKGHPESSSSHGLSSGQVTPWGDHSRVALLVNQNSHEISNPFSRDFSSTHMQSCPNSVPPTSDKKGSMAAFWRRRWHRSVHFYFKYVHIFSAVMASLALVLFILVIILGTLYYRMFARSHLCFLLFIFSIFDFY
jgi:hypothetical protein